MNLMFRKNFSEPSRSSSGPKIRKAGNRNAGKRTRDHGYGGSDDHYYRTHLFFSPGRSSYGQQDFEERCGPVLTSLSPNVVPSLTASGGTEIDLPQPLVVRSPSVSLPWGPSENHMKTSNVDIPTPTSSRQVSFSGSGVLSNASHNTMMKTSRSEPISLSTLDRDCFIIPVQRLSRFLPAGLPVPSIVPGGGVAVQEKIASPGASSPAGGAGTNTTTGSTGSGNISVLEVSDPKLCVLCHLMSPLEPIDPVLESPLSQPLARQKLVAGELLNEIAKANTAIGGMLLANMERQAEFPFIAYYVINSAKTDPSTFYNDLRTSSLNKFDPRTIRYTAAHTLDLYSEVAAICRPPLQDASNGLARSHTPATGYIISVYKVFEGDDGERFERNWLYWTGARMLYRYLPRCAGLKRIALHKSLSPKGDKMYLLVCECASLLQDVSAAALLVPALRARLCGYTGLYRPIQTF